MLSACVKNKDKLFAAVEKVNSKNRQKLRKVNHDSFDQAVFKWYLVVQSQTSEKTKVVKK